MAKVIALVGYEGPLPADYGSLPAPDPAMFGLPTDDDGSRNDPLVGQNMISGSHFRPELDALRAASNRIVLAVGVAPLAPGVVGVALHDVAALVGRAAIEPRWSWWK